MNVRPIMPMTVDRRSNTKNNSPSFKAILVPKVASDVIADAEFHVGMISLKNLPERALNVCPSKYMEEEPLVTLRRYVDSLRDRIKTTLETNEILYTPDEILSVMESQSAHLPSENDFVSGLVKISEEAKARTAKEVREGIEAFKSAKRLLDL